MAPPSLDCAQRLDLPTTPGTGDLVIGQSGTGILFPWPSCVVLIVELVIAIAYLVYNNVFFTRYGLRLTSANNPDAELRVIQWSFVPAGNVANPADAGYAADPGAVTNVADPGAVGDIADPGTGGDLAEPGA